MDAPTGPLATWERLGRDGAVAQTDRARTNGCMDAQAIPGGRRPRPCEIPGSSPGGPHHLSCSGSVYRKLR